MNKFTKIKKTLAVSLCSTMLFSGAPKASGMNSENIPLQHNKGLRKLGGNDFVKERSISTLDWLLGTVAVSLLGFINILVYSSDINENISSSKQIYNKLEKLLNLFKKDEKECNHSENNSVGNKIRKMLHENLYSNSNKPSMYLELSKRCLEGASNHEICKRVEYGRCSSCGLCNRCCNVVCNCICSTLSCISNCFADKAESKANFVKSFKKDIVTIAYEALKEIKSLISNGETSEDQNLIDNKESKDEINLNVGKNSKDKLSKNLKDKLNDLEKLLNLIEKLENPEIHLDYAFECTIDFLREANIITPEEFNEMPISFVQKNSIK